MGYNSGFSRANNAGIRIANGEIVLLLNSDTLNEGNAVARCVERFVTSDYVGCGVQLLNPDRSPQISGNYFMTGALNQLLMLPFVGRLVKWLGDKFKVKKTNIPEAKATIEVDWINGAFLMVKTKAIEQAGLLDEDFFLYFEEIEWCARLRKVGKMCLYGDLHLVHLMGVTADKTFDSAAKGYDNLFDRKGLQIMVSALLRVRKQYGAGWFLFHLLSYLITIPILLVVVLITFPLKSPYRYSIKQFFAFTGNCIKLLSFSPRMLINKPYFYKTR
jgi:GT2 family glycosyltransferase